MGHRYHIRACDIEAEELTMTDDKKGPNTPDPREVLKSLTTEHLTTLIPAEKPSDPATPAAAQDGQEANNPQPTPDPAAPAPAQDDQEANNPPPTPDSGSAGDGTK